MKVFSTLEPEKRWYRINHRNVEQLLCQKPYKASNNKRFALCPYCGNPVEIVIASNLSSGTTQSKIFSRHLKRTVPKLAEFDQARYNACLLRKAKRAFVFDPSYSGFSIAIGEVNISALRKALTSYLGIYASDRLTYALALDALPKFRHVRNIDVFNYPFAILLLTPQIRLNGRIVYSKKLAGLIRENSRFFAIDENHQIVPKDQRSATVDLLIAPSKQRIEESGLVSLELIVKERTSKDERILGTHKIVATMFDDLERKIL